MTKKPNKNMMRLGRGGGPSIKESIKKWLTTKTLKFNKTMLSVTLFASWKYKEIGEKVRSRLSTLPYPLDKY